MNDEAHTVCVQSPPGRTFLRTDQAKESTPIPRDETQHQDMIFIHRQHRVQVVSCANVRTDVRPRSPRAISVFVRPRSQRVVQISIQTKTYTAVAFANLFENDDSRSCTGRETKRRGGSSPAGKKRTTRSQNVPWRARGKGIR